MINQDKITTKKSILYVDKNYSPNSAGYGRDQYIREGLTKKYDLTVYHNLDYAVIDYMEKALSERKFDGVITNMPYDNEAPYYPGPAGEYNAREKLDHF